MRPSRWRSACATPSSCSRSRLTVGVLPPRRPAACRRRGLYIRRMRVLVAPDKFRGTLTARQAARGDRDGLARGPAPTTGSTWCRWPTAARARWRPWSMPLGGRGRARHGHRARSATRSRRAFGLVPTADGTLGRRGDGAGLRARSSWRRTRRDPRRTTTRGTGELIGGARSRAAPARCSCAWAAAPRTTAGSGWRTALGVRFLDAQGRDVAAVGVALLELARIDATRMRDRRLARRDGRGGACDVDNPLTGPTGASAVYGPQKGASPDDVLAARSRARPSGGRRASAISASTCKDEPGAGAAGGLGFGLLAFCGARLRPGVDVVMDARRTCRARIGGADLVDHRRRVARRAVPAREGRRPGSSRLASRARGPGRRSCAAEPRSRPKGVPVVSLVDRVGARGRARRRAAGRWSWLAEELAGRRGRAARERRR